MRKKVGLLSVITDTSRQNWYDSAVWLLYAGFGSLIPIIISAVILVIAGNPIRLVDFARHAEFGIYSAVLLASSAYLVCKDVKTPFPNRQLFILIIIICIMLVTAFFASVTIFSKVDFFKNFPTLDENMIKNWTVGLFIFSLTLGFFVNLLDSVISRFDIRQIHTEQERQLETEFDDLGAKDE